MTVQYVTRVRESEPVKGFLDFAFRNWIFDRASGTVELNLLKMNADGVGSAEGRRPS